MKNHMKLYFGLLAIVFSSQAHAVEIICKVYQGSTQLTVTLIEAPAPNNLFTEATGIINLSDELQIVVDATWTSPIPDSINDGPTKSRAQASIAIQARLQKMTHSKVEVLDFQQSFPNRYTSSLSGQAEAQALLRNLRSFDRQVSMNPAISNKALFNAFADPLPYLIMCAGPRK